MDDDVSVRLARGDGTFDPRAAFGVGDLPGVAVGDFNKDGRTVSLAPAVLWPPNHRMVTVETLVSATVGFEDTEQPSLGEAFFSVAEYSDGLASSWGSMVTSCGN